MTKQLMLIAKGVAMGAADVVPGVSGGTIALLTGIYPRLINAITGLNIHSLKALAKGQFAEFWRAIDGCFILPLLIGIGSAFLILAHPIKYAIAHHPIPTWSFFFGLIVASAILIIKQMEDKKLLNYLWLIPGVFVGFWIGIQTSIPFGNDNSAVLIAGMLAICAMILPGISGSFILVLLGMYEVLISAVTNKEYTTLLIFIAGAVIGLIFFSRIIKAVLSKFYQQTLFFLSGLMLGSLVKVWPWKTTSASPEQVKAHSVIINNVMPMDYPNSMSLIAIFMALLAIVLVFTIEYIGKKLQANHT
jgi:putative membrane protein